MSDLSSPTSSVGVILIRTSQHPGPPTLSLTHKPPAPKLFLSRSPIISSPWHPMVISKSSSSWTPQVTHGTVDLSILLEYIFLTWLLRSFPPQVFLQLSWILLSSFLCWFHLRSPPCNVRMTRAQYSDLFFFLILLSSLVISFGLWVLNIINMVLMPMFIITHAHAQLPIHNLYLNV